MDYAFRPVSGRLWVIHLSEELGRRVKAATLGWPSDEKQRLGDQLVRATDSIGANVFKGYARVHIKERINFYSIAQGSLEEALFWLRKARDRKLIDSREAGILSSLFIKLSRGLGNLSASQIKPSHPDFPNERKE